MGLRKHSRVMMLAQEPARARVGGWDSALGRVEGSCWYGGREPGNRRLLLFCRRRGGLSMIGHVTNDEKNESKDEKKVLDPTEL